MSKLNDYLRGQTRVILAEYDASKGIKHLGAKGTAREIFIQKFLRSCFPSKFIFNSGEIIDSAGSVSPQADIVVYDESMPVLPHSSVHQYFAEGVLAHIEVKSSLDKKALTEAMMACSTVQSLAYNLKPTMTFGEKRTSIPSFVVAYEGPEEQTFKKNFFDIAPDELRLVHFVTMREGLHIQRKQLQTEKSNGSLPIIDSKNMDRYSFRWLPRYYFENGEEESFRTSRGPRLIIRKTGDHIVATVTPEDESFVLQSLYQSVKLENGVNPYFILGIMNSKFMSFIYQNSEFGQKGRIMAQFRKAGLDRMPMPQKNEELEAQIIDESKKLIELVSLKPNSDAEAEVANRQIEAAEKAINTLVYNIYGLTDPEIETVEAG